MKNDLRKIFNKYDPMRIDGPYDKYDEEYDPEIDLILERLSEFQTPEINKQMIIEIFIEMFDHDFVKERLVETELDAIAREIDLLIKKQADS